MDGQEPGSVCRVGSDQSDPSPLVGFYKPDNSISTQLGDADTNVYAQVLAIVPF